MNKDKVEKLFNKDLCIICQKLQKKCTVTSTENGRRQIRNCASLRRDDVYYRLNLLSTDDIFYYHMNNECYKKYTMKSYLEKFNQTDSTINNENLNPATSGSTDNFNVLDRRKSNRSAEKFVADDDKCVICGKATNKKVTKLFELGEVRATQLFAATRLFHDEVFTRTSLLTNPEAFAAAKLKYHSTCLRQYEHEYEKTKKSETHDLLNCSDEVNDIMYNVIKSIEPELFLGRQFSLSDISKLIAEKNDGNFIVKNEKIKYCLIDHFGEDISFIYPKQKNRSQIFYYSKINPKNKNNVGYDAISECADILRQSLTEMDFTLDDKFCDENDLRFSWDNTQIPEPFAIFFSKLFNLNKQDIQKKTDDFDSLGNNSNNNIKLLRVKNIFQTMYFIKNAGFKKTPIHTALGLFVYHTTKSKNTITVLNRIGCSISYDEILRIRTRLAVYATENCSSNVPLPTHFNPNKYVTAAFDNFDHNEATLSGLNSTHDTVIVIFQENDSEHSQRKPSISEAPIYKCARSFTENLKCQELKSFVKMNNQVIIPFDYSINNDNRSLTLEKLENNLCKDDLAWFLSRLLFKKESDENVIDLVNTNQQVPSWSSFHSTLATDTRSMQKIGFLPILPFSVTDYSTVYTCLCNFNNLLSQLNQEFLAVTCDEGVYRIARTILFQRPQEFNKIILCMGSFHITKVLHTCIGKYLKNSGVEHIFIESGLFGMSVVEQILNGTHYARCTKAFTYLAESLRRLQIKEFFGNVGSDKYEQLIVTVILLQENFASKNIDECKYNLNEFNNSCSELLADFQTFISVRCNQSELFRYWNNVLILISLMHDLIRSDRTGDWHLHLKTIEKLQPIFHALDRVNYARWCSVYLEDMLVLEKNSPEVYAQFINGRFTVKKNKIPFTSVGTDQALEQTINRVSKSAGGIIGCTKKKETVAAWNLTFHELLAVSNFLKKITYFSNDDEELLIHHEYSNTNTVNSEKAVEKIIQFIESKTNPFASGSQELKNIVTEELVQPEITKQLLCVFNKGIELYEVFRKERFCEKSKPLTALLSRNNLPNFKSVLKSEESTSKKAKKICTSETQRIIALANERKYPLKELLKYELTEKNPLFDADGLFKKESNKSLLTRELEKILIYENVEFVTNNVATCMIVDVMLVMRKISWKNIKNFGELGTNFSEYILKKAASQNIKRIDFIFDSYYESSIKSSEHLRRRKSDCITYNQITENMSLPRQEDKFWNSPTNKILLQQFLRNFLQKNIRFVCFQIVFSTINNDRCSSISFDLSSTEMLQRDDVEEADVKIIIHSNHAVTEKYSNLYILSSDTDVIVLLLYFFRHFQDNGLQTLWVHAGVGQSMRNIPVHLLATLHGEKICSVLPALHHLTGADYTSKVGTKLSALQADPVQYLLQFGKDCSEAALENSISMAESYLIKVLRKGTQCKTFDELRLWSYYHAKCTLIEDLPPTSNSIRLHILRAFYVVYNHTNCLNKNIRSLNPLQYGWKVLDDLLLPEKIEILLPPAEELIYNCTCKVCTRKNCVCLSAEIPCCTFCFCKKNNTCKNKYNE